MVGTKWVMMFVAIILGITGCVSKEDYNQKVAELEAAQQEIATLKQSLTKKDKEISQLEADKNQEIATLKQSITGKDKEISQLEAGKNDIATKLSTLEKELADTQKQAQETDEAYQKQILTTKQTQDKLTQSMNEVATLGNLVSRHEAELAELKKNLMETSEKMTASQEMADTKTKALEELRNSFDEIVSNNSTLQEQLAEKSKLLTELQENIALKDEDLIAAKQLLANKETSLAEAQQLLDDKDKILAEAQQFLSDKEESLAQTQQLLADKEESLAQAQQVLTEKSAALGELENQLQEVRTTFSASSTELSNLQNQLKTKDAALKEKDDQINQLMEQIDLLKKGAGLPGAEGVKGLLKQ